MRVILVAPSLPENVGMVARAMRAFDVADLVLVGGVAPTHRQAVAAAPGAEDVLTAARQVRTLAEALEGVSLAIATTARAYARPDLRVVTARAAAQQPVPGTAWVFGTERHGLEIAEIRQCHQIARIPSVGQSLNLAQAVAICLYECRAAAGAEGADSVEQPASALLADEPNAARAVARWLQRIGAAREKDADAKGHSLLRIASRLRVDEHEAALLRAIWTRLSKGEGS